MPGTGVGTIGSCCQIGYPGVYAGIEDKVAKDRQESLQVYKFLAWTVASPVLRGQQVPPLLYPGFPVEVGGVGVALYFKSEKFGNGVRLLHLNRIRAQAPCS